LSGRISAFSKILIAVDGSQSSMNAASNAIAIAKKEHNSKEYLAVAVETPNPLREILEGAKIEAQQWFDIIQKKINGDNNIRLQAEVVVTATSIVSAIVE
jgi:universal stress protein family protein